jgi:hypothetical protein
MDDAERIARMIEQAAAEAVTHLRQSSVHWIDLFYAGEMLYTDEAAAVYAKSAETVRRRCEGSADTNCPLGILLAESVWMVSLARVLDDIEARDGRHAMLAAASRATKIAETRSSPQKSLRSRVAATG